MISRRGSEVIYTEKVTEYVLGKNTNFGIFEAAIQEADLSYIQVQEKSKIVIRNCTQYEI